MSQTHNFRESKWLRSCGSDNQSLISIIGLQLTHSKISSSSPSGSCSGVKPPKCVSTVIETPRAETCHWRLLSPQPLSFSGFPGTLIVATCFKLAVAQESIATSSASKAASRSSFAPALSSPLGMPRTRYVSALAFYLLGWVILTAQRFPWRHLPSPRIGASVIRINLDGLRGRF